MNSPIVLALDIGTSSVRAIAFDRNGKKVGDAVQIGYEQQTSSDGGVQIGAEFLLSLCEKCLDKLVPLLTGEVAAIGISCFWHSLLAVDQTQKAQTPVLSWADNRSAPSVEFLRAIFDERQLHARLGCVFHTSYWPAKLLHLHAHNPELFGRGWMWLGFGEFLRLRWCGDARMSFSMASGTGIFDQNALDFDDEMLAALPVAREDLPALCDLQSSGRLLAPWKNRWPELKNALVFPAIGDGACSNIGSGSCDSSKIGINAGTSGAMRVVLRDFSGAAPQGLWRYRVDKNRSIVGGALSNCGNLLVWARDTFRLPGDWQAQVEKIAPDSHDLTVLPFLAGERAPLWNADARFVLSGAHLSTSPVQILRAVLEGGALRFAALGALMREIAPAAEFIFSGGALEKVPVWQSIICDAIGAHLTQSLEWEASARGAALLTLETLGQVDDAASVPFERGETLRPNQQNHAIYTRALQRQNAFYDQI